MNAYRKRKGEKYVWSYAKRKEWSRKVKERIEWDRLHWPKVPSYQPTVTKPDNPRIEDIRGFISYVHYIR